MVTSEIEREDIDTNRTPAAEVVSQPVTRRPYEQPEPELPPGVQRGGRKFTTVHQQADYFNRVLPALEAKERAKEAEEEERERREQGWREQARREAQERERQARAELESLRDQRQRLEGDLEGLAEEFAASRKITDGDLQDGWRLLIKVGALRKLLGQAHDLAGRLERIVQSATVAENRLAYFAYIADHPSQAERDPLMMTKLESGIYCGGGGVFSSEIPPRAASFLRWAGLPLRRDTPLAELVGGRVAEAAERVVREIGLEGVTP